MNFAVFSALLVKLLPLYFFVGLGVIAGRFIKVDRLPISRLLLYMMVPLVFFLSILDAELTPARMGMPIVFLLMASFISIVFYKVLGRRWERPDRNILAYMVGSGNTGYFGLPAIIALWGQERVPNAILVVFGYVMFESTVGFYLTARGHYSAKESLKRVLKLPALYAFALAAILNFAGFHKGQFLLLIEQRITSVYAVLGLMMIGLGVSHATKKHLDWSFVGITILFKFIVWPFLMAAFIILDRYLWHVYSTQDHQVLILMSIVPLAANGVVVATELRAQPEKTAICILITTVLALFFIPAVIPLVVN